MCNLNFRGGRNLVGNFKKLWTKTDQTKVILTERSRSDSALSLTSLVKKRIHIHFYFGRIEVKEGVLLKF